MEQSEKETLKTPLDKLERIRALRILKRILGECYECKRPAFKGGRCKRHYLYAMRSQLRRRDSSYSDRRLIAFLRSVAKTGGDRRIMTSLKIVCSCGYERIIRPSRAKVCLTVIANHDKKHKNCKYSIHPVVVEKKRDDEGSDL